jgi:hypothetical protein
LSFEKTRNFRLGTGSYHIANDGICSRVEALKIENTKLTELYLSLTGLTGKGTKAIANALKSGKLIITYLNLSWKDVGDEGAEFMADSLKMGRTFITHFQLNECAFGPNGANALSEAFGRGRRGSASLPCHKQYPSGWNPLLVDRRTVIGKIE